MTWKQSPAANGSAWFWQSVSRYPRWRASVYVTDRGGRFVSVDLQISESLAPSRTLDLPATLYLEIAKWLSLLKSAHPRNAEAYFGDLLGGCRITTHSDGSGYGLVSVETETQGSGYGLVSVETETQGSGNTAVVESGLFSEIADWLSGQSPERKIQ